MKLPDRILEPGERISEILFGLIMALTVTGATSIVTADRFQIRTMLIAAFGCNVAWGIIDAGMYLMARLIERGGNTLLLREIREAPDNETAHRVIADALPPLVSRRSSGGKRRSVTAICHNDMPNSALLCAWGRRHARF
jgi:hypothetical protein